MGRTLKRVPLDFNYQIGVIWEGYLNPFSSRKSKCYDCEGTGYSPEALFMHKQWYAHWGKNFSPQMTGSKPVPVNHPVVERIAKRNIESMFKDNQLKPIRINFFELDFDSFVLLESKRLADLYNSSWSHHLDDDDVAALISHNRLKEFTHTWTRENGWVCREDGYIPTAHEVNEWSLDCVSHDAINEHVCIVEKCNRKGYQTICVLCNGDGHIWDSSEDEELYENWMPSGPPKGEGYQLWETTSEGSPASPVFESLDSLCEWCAENVTTFGSFTATKDEWISMLDHNFVYHEGVTAEGKSIILL